MEENIKWGKETAAIEEVEEAAQVAQAHEFIKSFLKDTIQCLVREELIFREGKSSVCQ